MTLTGKQLIGAQWIVGSPNGFMAVDPAANEGIEPAYTSATPEQVDRACELAWSAFETFRDQAPTDKARFLTQIAENIRAAEEHIVERAGQETGLPEARIRGEIGRTCGQLNLFAERERSGFWLDSRIDEAMPNREPIPRADIRMRYVSIGPVAVFGASNFPLAFSVAGGDTVSAFAAGSPVIVKAHSAHPGTSEIVGNAIQKAVEQCALPEGVFSLLFDSGFDVATRLVSHPHIRAVGFTGSRQGGLALAKIAASRDVPIPVYAEMSSINPVFMLPGALANDLEIASKQLVQSVTMGAGQFCTNPGLIVGISGKAWDEFQTHTVAELAAVECGLMLTPNIHSNYEAGRQALRQNQAIKSIGTGPVASKNNQCQAELFSTTAEEFMQDSRLSNEIFGAATLFVGCRNEETMMMVADHLEGQLTASIHAQGDGDLLLAGHLVRLLESKAGRIIFNDYPTGVEVCDAMVHGGPFPATTDTTTTSVGTAAVKRFLRPVCYQDIPDRLLPKVIADSNPYGVTRLINGSLSVQ